MAPTGLTETCARDGSFMSFLLRAVLPFMDSRSCTHLGGCSTSTFSLLVAIPSANDYKFTSKL